MLNIKHLQNVPQAQKGNRHENRETAADCRLSAAGNHAKGF